MRMLDFPKIKIKNKKFDSKMMCHNLMKWSHIFQNNRSHEIVTHHLKFKILEKKKKKKKHCSFLITLYFSLALSLSFFLFFFFPLQAMFVFCYVGSCKTTSSVFLICQREKKIRKLAITVKSEIN
jgi:hypothetical protein